MIPKLKKSGVLPAGIYAAGWEELESRFAATAHRQELLAGLKQGLKLLREYGCREIYIGGSFVTDEAEPGDIDVAYDNGPMNWKQFISDHPEFKGTKYGVIAQKKKYRSEFHAFNAYEDYILHFFQFDRNHNPKGIIKLNLAEMSL